MKARVCDNATLSDNATVGDYAVVGGDSVLTNETLIGDRVEIRGCTEIGAVGKEITILGKGKIEGSDCLHIF